jgi:7-cyano-7-deazaguanine synthase
MVVLLSGGIDSTVLVYEFLERKKMYAVLIDYGQRHVRELQFAQELCREHDIPFGVVRTELFRISGALLLGMPSQIPVFKLVGRETVVPNRNMIMLSIAAAAAEQFDAEEIGIAAHAGDHAIYADCRIEFFRAMESVLRFSMERNLRIRTPFIKLRKSEIVELGAQIGVDFKRTWSCYRGEERPCKECGACMERRNAFDAAQLLDPWEVA